MPDGRFSIQQNIFTLILGITEGDSTKMDGAEKIARFGAMFKKRIVNCDNERLFGGLAGPSVLCFSRALADFGDAQASQGNTAQITFAFARSRPDDKFH